MLADARTSRQKRKAHAKNGSLAFARSLHQLCFLLRVTFASLALLVNHGSFFAVIHQRARRGSVCVLRCVLLCPGLQNHRQKIRFPRLLLQPNKVHNLRPCAPLSRFFFCFPPSIRKTKKEINKLQICKSWAGARGGGGNDRFFCHWFCFPRVGATYLLTRSARSSHDRCLQARLRASSERLVPRTFSVARKRNPARAFLLLRCTFVGGRYRLPPPARSLRGTASTQSQPVFKSG